MPDGGRLNGRIGDMLPRLWPLVVLVALIAAIALAASFRPPCCSGARPKA